jgi:hypothetical protein
VSPAPVGAGVSDHVWKIEEIVALLRLPYLTMSLHMVANRFFGGLAMVVAGAVALGAVFLFALGWSNDPNDHLYGVIGAVPLRPPHLLAGLPSLLPGSADVAEVTVPVKLTRYLIYEADEVEGRAVTYSNLASS